MNVRTWFHTKEISADHFTAVHYNTITLLNEYDVALLVDGGLECQYNYQKIEVFLVLINILYKHSTVNMI